MSSTDVRTRRVSGRSPAYPAVSLAKAVARVGELYRRDRRYPVPVEKVHELWGYKSLNGATAQIVSSLLQFGLITDEGVKGERVITVTLLAEDLLQHPSEDARYSAMKTAALSPRMHAELWEAYGARLPSDANLQWRLTRDYGFTDTGARELAREWRETMEFAHLTELDASPAHRAAEPSDAAADARTGAEPSATVLDDGSPRGDAANAAPQGPDFFDANMQKHFANSFGTSREATQPTAPSIAPSAASAPTAGPTSAMQSYPIPIARTGRPPVIITGAFPLSEEEWGAFMKVLNAMQPVLVETSPVGTPAVEAKDELL